MLSQIDYSGVMFQVIRYGVYATILALAETVELDLRLMVGVRGVLSAPDYVPLLLDYIEQADDVAEILEGIEVGLVLDLVSEVLVTAPQDSGEYII